MAAKKSTVVPKKAPGAMQSRLFWLASLVFFVSGGTGLVYQVVWFKRISHVWGSSSLAFAAVAGSFLFGLGLGAYLMGRWADRAVVPLRWYGVSELAIGFLALVIPFEITALVDASVGLYARLPEEPLLRYLMQFAITLVVIGPPCVLMGGTLPLLIRQLTARDGSLDEATGWLYAINTFGAATGCYLAGFHLLPSLGLLWTNNIAAGVNIAIGLVSLAVSNSIERLALGRHATKQSTVAAAPLSAWSPQLALLYLATALTGCAALVLEMTWTRQLALVLGGSTYALTATLFVVLVGIALGSLIFHTFLREVAGRPIVPIAVIGMVVLASLAGALLLPSLTLWVAPEDIRGLRGNQFGNGLVCVAASAVLELVPAIGMGILFPLFVHLTHAGAARVGSAVGNIYAWNTLGSIIGGSFTAILLFPRIGTAGAAALATGMYVVSLLAIIPWRGTVNLATAGATAAIGAAAVALIARPIDPRLTNMGLYIYGSGVVGQNAEDTKSQMQTLFFDEGASSSVFVSKRYPSNINLRVNGKVDASNGLDMGTQTGSAYFPHFFKPDAKNVLLIGFGCGCTSGRSLLFPGTHVTCCELEPAVYAAADQFGMFNSRPYEKTRAALEAKNATLSPDQKLTPEQIDREARFTIIFGDGRSALQGSDQKYDIISSEPSNPWIAGVSNLFTREFFRTAREHLTDGGVLAQWIQTYQFTISDYMMIVRTMRTEFPYYGVIELAGGADTLLLASTRPLMPDLKALAEIQKLIDTHPEVNADFKAWFGSTDVRWVLLSDYVLGKEQLDQLVDKEPSKAINTDLNLQLEFDAPLHLFRKLDAKERADVLLAGAGREVWTAQLAKSFGLDASKPEFHVELGDCIARQGASAMMMSPQPALWVKADKAYQMALTLKPGHEEATRGRQRVQLWADRTSDRKDVLRKILEVKPDDPVAHGAMADVLLQGKDRRGAIEQYREALRLMPNISFETRTYGWANNLAWLLATSPQDELRNGPEALTWAQRARSIAKNADLEVIDTVAAALAENGRFEEAIKLSNELIELSVERPDFVKGIKERVKLYEASQPYREVDKEPAAAGKSDSAQPVDPSQK